jgi:hypothetical protein
MFRLFLMRFMAPSVLGAAITDEVALGCTTCSDVAAVPAVGDPLGGLLSSFMLAAAPVREKALWGAGISTSLGCSGGSSLRAPSVGRELGREAGLSMG